MTLRAKLILAFLFLAVVPLVVVTVYSYASSVEALHRTAERESGIVADQMRSRMELVASDLVHRVDDLGALPFRSLVGAEEQADGAAGAFAVDLVERMGPSAAFLDALEFVPAAPAAPAVATTVSPMESEAPRTPLPAPGDESPVVIHLSRMLFNPDTMEQLQELRDGAGVLRTGGEIMLLPRGLMEARIEVNAEELLPAELFEALIRVGEDAQAGELGSMDAIVHSIEKSALVFAEQIEARARDRQERHQEVEQRNHEIERRPVEFEKKHWEWKQEFVTEIERDGEVVGTVTARVNAQQALLSVLQRVDPAEGEIPFAVDDMGELHTLNDEDQQILNGLNLSAAALAGAPTEGLTVGDWIVVTRAEPSLGLAFGIARPVGESLDEIRTVNARNLGYGLGVVTLAMLGIVPLSGRMTRDLSELSAGVARLSSGDLETAVPVRSRDEIGELARTFNRMTADLRRNQEQLVEQERLGKELEMSRQIQEELLPHAAAAFPFADVKGVSIPAREVGGDFFNYFLLPGGDVAIVMGDVSGKGMPAALLMANLQATLKARMPHERNLADLVSWLDVEVDGNTPSESYVTLFVAALDHERLTLRYVNAGHNSQYALVSGRLERLESVGRPVGLLPGGSYVEQTLALSPGDSLFLFTDGLTEAENEDGEEFGTERLEALLLEAKRNVPDRLLARVEKAAARHRGRTVAADDATMLALRVGSPA